MSAAICFFSCITFFCFLLRSGRSLSLIIIDLTVSQTPCANYEHRGTSEKFKELNQCHRCWLACAAWRGRCYILNTQSSRCSMLTSQDSVRMSSGACSTMGDMGVVVLTKVRDAEMGLVSALQHWHSLLKY